MIDGVAAGDPPASGIVSQRRADDNTRTRLGLLRSLLIYYGVPFKLRRIAALYRPFIHPGDLCFDIGAHVGDRTRVMRRLGARVVAVEPQSTLARWLRWSYRSDPATVILEVGVGATGGKGELLVSERTPTVSSLSPEWVAGVRTAPRFAGVTWDRRAQVRITTLDALIACFGRPSFCKLDVEGSEGAALAGLSQAIPALTFEFIPAQCQAARACLDRLETLGRYEYNWSEREDPRLRAVEWISADEMAERVAGLPDGAHSGDVYARLRVVDSGA